MLQLIWGCRYLWVSVFITLEYILISGITGLYGSSIFSFIRNFHTVFHSGSTNLKSRKQYTVISFSLHVCQHLLSLGFLMMAILTGMRKLSSDWLWLHYRSFGMLYFHFHFSQDTLFTYLLISSLTHWLFSSVLFNLHVFVKSLFFLSLMPIFF